jgi:antitoxin CcdA
MRMKNVYDLGAPKKATNLSVNSDLLAQAKALGINVSAVLEKSLAEHVRDLKAQRWKQDNHDSIVAYNEDVENNGTYSDGSRSF